MDSHTFHVCLFSKMGVEVMVETGKISVAVTTYNGETYLREQLDSILENLREQDELIISDDGSKDATLNIIGEYLQKDQRVHLVKGPRQGIKKNVENAIRQCSGEYIFLADQDDIWMPHKVKRVMEVFEREHCNLIIHDAKVILADNPREVFMPSFMEFRNAGAGVWKNMVKNSYIGCCMAFHGELKKIILPVPEDIEMHDQWIGILNDWYFGDSVFLKEPLILYRRHGQNNSQMTHYGLRKMIRNRMVFACRFWQRVRKIHKSRGSYL